MTEIFKPPRKHPDWIQAFVNYASFGEAPLTMYFWVGVSAVAGALRRRVWLDMGYFEWIPNFYVILVAPPGIVSKSTTASIGMNLLRRVPGIKFGPDVVTWQKLAQSLAQSLEMFEMPNGDLMPMSALTIESSEFGTFLNPSDREMVDVLVSLWDGKKGTFTKSTKTQGDDAIENPFINIIACTTPSWIEGNFPEYMVGGGFTSRCIFIYAEQKRQYCAYPADHIPPDFLELQSSLVADLERISTLCGPYILTPDAKIWGERWYESHYTNKPAHLDNERFGGYLARKQTHIHKLAMVLAASRGDSMQIDTSILELADNVVSSLEADMPKVFDKIGTTPEARGAMQLVSVVRSHGTITSQALFRRLFNTLDFESYRSALNAAINAGYVEQFSNGTSTIIKAKYDATPTNPQA